MSFQRSRHHEHTETTTLEWYYPICGYTGRTTVLKPSRGHHGEPTAHVVRDDGHLMAVRFITEEEHARISAPPAPVQAFRKRTR